jgi:hypothetical protein
MSGIAFKIGGIGISDLGCHRKRLMTGWTPYSNSSQEHFVQSAHKELARKPCMHASHASNILGACRHCKADHYSVSKMLLFSFLFVQPFHLYVLVYRGDASGQETEEKAALGR